MKNDLFSHNLVIIIPVLNCLEYTREMVKTIKTKEDYKLILINNGSIDGTQTFFEYLGKDENTTVFNFRENRGVSWSWNFGIKYAIEHFESDYFFIPNNDTLLHPKCIDNLISELQTAETVMATAYDVSGEISQPIEVTGLEVPVKREVKESPDFSGFMIAKKTLDKVGYFDENFYPAYFEDNDYHYRIKLAGLKAYRTNQALYFHYGSRTIKDNKYVKTASNQKFLANQEYFKTKWGDVPGKEKFTTPFNGDKEKLIQYRFKE
jgi:GT2 family glycosyltransferase